MESKLKNSCLSWDRGPRYFSISRNQNIIKIKILNLHSTMARRLWSINLRWECSRRKMHLTSSKIVKAHSSALTITLLMNQLINEVSTLIPLSKHKISQELLPHQFLCISSFNRQWFRMRSRNRWMFLLKRNWQLPPLLQAPTTIIQYPDSKPLRTKVRWWTSMHNRSHLIPLSKRVVRVQVKRLRRRNRKLMLNLRKTKIYHSNTQRKRRRKWAKIKSLIHQREK